VPVPITACAALRLPRTSAVCPGPRAGRPAARSRGVPRQRRAVRRVSLAVSEFGQLGARRHDPRTARTEIDDQCGVNLDADDPAEAVRIVGHLIPHGELLGRRGRGWGAEGASREEAPGRGAGWLHHYQYAPSGSIRLPCRARPVSAPGGDEKRYRGALARRGGADQGVEDLVVAEHGRVGGRVRHRQRRRAAGGITAWSAWRMAS
jgi:hypothetical protein